jgi:hypothetical protein
MLAASPFAACARLAARACILLAASASSWAGSHDKDVQRMLDGVQLMPPAGYPGWIAVVGPEAFPVVVGRENGIDQPVVAAAEHGAGRVVLFGHNGYLGPDSWDGGDGWRLLENCIRWATRSERGKPRVGVWNNQGMAEALSKRGMAGESFGDFARFEKGLKFDAVMFTPWNFTSGQLETLAKYVKSGGAILCGETGWGWSQYNGKMSGNGGNWLFGPMGLVYSDGIAHGRRADGFPIHADPSEFCNAQLALDALTAKEPPAGFGEAQARQATWTIAQAVRLLPDTDKLLRPRLAKLRGRAPAVPTPDAPLRSSSTLERIALSLQIEEAFAAPAMKVKALPAAKAFPGQPREDAPRLTKIESINASIHDWRGIGLMAAAGELVEVTLPAEHAKQGWRVQIGCHVDDIAHLGEWRRAPRVAGSWPLDEGTTKVVSPFGGLVYILPGEKAAGQVQVKVRGAVEAPRYVLGRTTPEEWRRQRALGAPWAEIEAPSIILSVPAAEVRALEDPRPIAAKWEEALRACADLAGLVARGRPERVVADVQLASGQLRAGQPLGCDLESAALLLDPARWAKEGHAAFRELGRNHQSADWTFEGVGEANCDLFALHVLEQVCGKAVDDDERFLQGARDARWRDHVENHDASFDRWKGDSSLALLLQLDVQQQFGWEPFKQAFREYRGLKDHERPRNDDEKRDQWLVRLSRACGADLSFLFAAWGVPVSDAARGAASAFKPWRPENRLE